MNRFRTTTRMCEGSEIWLDTDIKEMLEMLWKTVLLWRGM